MNQETESAVLPEALFNLPYGIYLITAEENGKDNGCIINTVTQVTNQPNRISISINKNSLTHDMIQRTGKFNVSVLTEGVTLETIAQFGFSSGKEHEKFKNFSDAARSDNGILYLTHSANTLLSASVIGMHDYITHTLFVSDLTEARILTQEPSVTYAYYQQYIKPKDNPVPVTGSDLWVCNVCGYVYDGVKEGIPFAALPSDWKCPVCGHPKSDFAIQSSLSVS